MFDVSKLKYDAAGLIPAVLIDYKTKDVLMVAWMNAKSVQMTIETKLATFWSRSRKELWIKGETSKNYMHIKTITADCDFDTLLLEVQADGPACHLGTKSCFTHRVL